MAIAVAVAAVAAIVTMAAAIVTIANIVMAAVVEPQQSWVVAIAVVVATKPPLSRSSRGRSHQAVVEPQQSWS